MREILFRAKQKDKGNWVEGYYIRQDETAYCFKEDYERHPENTKHYIVFDMPTDWGLPNRHLMAEIDPETLCQYTGVKDKNEKRIFEGDIFVFDDEVWESAYTSCGIEYDSCDVKNYGAVGYCDYSASFDFTKYKYNENSVEADLHENNTLDFVEFVSELEVCGNIFDNPELLEGE